MRGYFPGDLILAATWLFVSVACWRLSVPAERDILGCALAGFLLAVPLCLPVAILSGLLVRLFECFYRRQVSSASFAH
jgi:hypothetical protein